MKLLLFFIITSYFSPLLEAFSKEKVPQVQYLKSMYGHIHQNPSIYSSSLTTVSCGHPIKVYDSSKKSHGEKWKYVKVGLFTGYIKKNLLSKKQPGCLQDRYPRFYEELKLGTTDIYYWGRLYDHYISRKTKVKK